MVALEGYFREARNRNICIIRGRSIRHLQKRCGGKHTSTTSQAGCCALISTAHRSCGYRSEEQSGASSAVGRPVRPGRCGLVLHGRTPETVDTGIVTAEGNKIKRWTGAIVDGEVGVRLAFICDRALDCSEASSLTLLAEPRCPTSWSTAASAIGCRSITSGECTGAHPDRTRSRMSRPSG